MIVIADGDVAKNHVNKKTGTYLALGFDRFTRQEFGNRDFICVLISSLCAKTKFAFL